MLRAARRFFRKMLKTASHSSPRVINVDKNPACPLAVEQLKEEEISSNRTQLRQCKYLNNLVEQDPACREFSHFRDDAIPETHATMGKNHKPLS